MARDTLATGTNRKYMKHPPADDALSQVKDGHPLDAGTWHILVNNSHVLLAESARQVFADAIGLTSKATDFGWDNLDEDEPAVAERSATTTFNLIAWNVLGATPTARCYGPFPMISDRSDTTTAGRENLPRRLRVHVRYFSDGTNAFKVYVAFTTTDQPPTAGVFASDVTTWSTTSASDQDATVTFASFHEVGTTTRHSGTTTAFGSGFVAVPEYYVWVGWNMDAVTGTAGIRSVECWEWTS